MAARLHSPVRKSSCSEPKVWDPVSHHTICVMGGSCCFHSQFGFWWSFLTDIAECWCWHQPLRRCLLTPASHQCSVDMNFPCSPDGIVKSSVNSSFFFQAIRPFWKEFQGSSAVENSLQLWVLQELGSQRWWTFWQDTGQYQWKSQVKIRSLSLRAPWRQQQKKF